MRKEVSLDGTKVPCSTAQHNTRADEPSKVTPLRKCLAARRKRVQRGNADSDKRAPHVLSEWTNDRQLDVRLSDILDSRGIALSPRSTNRGGSQRDPPDGLSFQAGGSWYVRTRSALNWRPWPAVGPWDSCANTLRAKTLFVHSRRSRC